MALGIAQHPEDRGRVGRDHPLDFHALSRHLRILPSSRPIEHLGVSPGVASILCSSPRLIGPWNSTTRNTDSAARLRLVDVRLRAGEASLHFGGGLAGVYTTTADRSAAAHQIVATVMGPRPADAAGSVDINGRVVSVHSLPPLPLPPSAPAVLDRDDLSAHWQALCARRRGELAATHASRRARTPSHRGRARPGARAGSRALRAGRTAAVVGRGRGRLRRPPASPARRVRRAADSRFAR